MTLYQSASTSGGAVAATSPSRDSVPKVVFQPMDLVVLAKRDSAVILGTSGIYCSHAARPGGRGGKVTWERAAASPRPPSPNGAARTPSS